MSHNFGTQLTLRADERPRRIVGATNILFANDLRDNVTLHKLSILVGSAKKSENLWIFFMTFAIRRQEPLTEKFR